LIPHHYERWFSRPESPLRAVEASKDDLLQGWHCLRRVCWFCAFWRAWQSTRTAMSSGAASRLGAHFRDGKYLLDSWNVRVPIVSSKSNIVRCSARQSPEPSRCVGDQGLERFEEQRDGNPVSETPSPKSMSNTPWAKRHLRRRRVGHDGNPENDLMQRTARGKLAAPACATSSTRGYRPEKDSGRMTGAPGHTIFDLHVRHWKFNHR